MSLLERLIELLDGVPLFLNCVCQSFKRHIFTVRHNINFSRVIRWESCKLLLDFGVYCKTYLCHLFLFLLFKKLLQLWFSLLLPLVLLLLLQFLLPTTFLNLFMRLFHLFFHSSVAFLLSPHQHLPALPLCRLNPLPLSPIPAPYLLLLLHHGHLVLQLADEAGLSGRPGRFYGFNLTASMGEAVRDCVGLSV